jgi:tetratricopeptide (TPR) repeat protein
MDWFDLAYCHDDLQNFEAAVECCDKSWESDPRNADALTLKGYVLGELGRHEAAVECFDQALEIDPQDSYAWMRKGDTLDDLGRYEAALHCYEQVLQFDSAEQGRGFYHCEAMFALRRWQSGFESLAEAFRRSPRDTNHGVENFIDLVMKLSEGYEELQQHVSRLIAIYHEAGVLEYLGSGLLRSLRRIDVGRIGVETLENWRDAWLKLGGGYPVLEIPLRIFRVGIEYVLQGDEKVLLDLVTTERTILRQSLGLEMRDDVE